MTGIIRRLNEHRGFGFIEPLVGRPGCEFIFFHFSAICRRADGLTPALPAGSEVSFDLVRADPERGGVQAANIRLRVLNGSVLQSSHRGKLLSRAPADAVEAAIGTSTSDATASCPPAAEAADWRSRENHKSQQYRSVQDGNRD